MSDQTQRMEQAGLTIGNASYGLFGTTPGRRNVLSVDRDRVAGTIGLRGGQSIEKALAIVTESHEGHRQLEVHDFARSRCTSDCAAWQFTSCGSTSFWLDGADIASGRMSRVPDRLHASELWTIAHIMDGMAFSGSAYDIVEIAKKELQLQDGSLQRRVTSWAGGEDHGLLPVLQEEFGHSMAFPSSVGFLKQVRDSIEP